MNRTHIDSLADDSAKSRRQVRRTLGMKAGIPVGPLQAAWAQEKAELREQDGKRNDLQRRAASEFLKNRAVTEFMAKPENGWTRNRWFGGEKPWFGKANPHEE